MSLNPNFKAAYITTDTGNHIAKDAVVKGAQNIVLANKVTYIQRRTSPRSDMSIIRIY